MKLNIKFWTILCTWVSIGTGGFANDDKGAAAILLANDELSLAFDRQTGAFIGMSDMLSDKLVLYAGSKEGDRYWEIYRDADNRDKPLTIGDAGEFGYEMPDPYSLRMMWSGFKSPLDDLVVTVRITLVEGKSLSHWNIAVNHLSGNPVTKVAFPKLSGFRENEDVKLVVPEGMGQLIHDPLSVFRSSTTIRQIIWPYPGMLSMQFLALYDKEGTGFYFACDDPHTYQKDFRVALDDEERLSFQLDNIPTRSPNPISYTPRYNAVVGTFKGDWMTAATYYKKWAVNQSWTKNSRFRNGLTPQWLEQTALWVWNRGTSANVIRPAIELKERAGLNVNILWHWWHGCAYDDGFPEYFPPREGNDSFRSNIALAKDLGIRSLVYMNLLQWGTSTESFEREHALLHAVKDEKGQARSHVYNVFSSKSLTNMCITSPYWRNKYSGLAAKAVNDYGVGGIYMDQTCWSKICHDASHGHGLGGGNYWLRHSGLLTSQIRSSVPVEPGVVLSGEGANESWLPYLDTFLELRVSRERSSTITYRETIPLFQAVYHEYAIAYGSYASLLTPPYDELWPEEHKPENSLVLLDTAFSKQFMMEQARSFVWGMQPMIANYRDELAVERKDEIDYLLRVATVRSQNLKYMLRGVFCRPPEMDIPVKELTVSRLSIYAGQKENVTSYANRFPMVYCSAWKAPDQTLGIALASILDTHFHIRLDFELMDYGLGDSGEIYLNDIKGRHLLGYYRQGMVKIDHLLPPQGICILEFVPGS